MTRRPGILPTFFLSGFECSTFDWKDRGRRDLVEETRHRQCAREDYAMLRDLGIGVAREGVPWPMVERDGRYGFALRRVPFAPYVAELRRWQRPLNRVTVLDDDPLSDPVELQDVVDAAHRLRPRPDQDWS